MGCNEVETSIKRVNGKSEFQGRLRRRKVRMRRKGMGQRANFRIRADEFFIVAKKTWGSDKLQAVGLLEPRAKLQLHTAVATFQS